jgi:hypothetical protein
MTFDAKAFAASTTKSPLSTQIVPCPEGAFTAFVDDAASDVTEWFREVNWNDKKTGQPRTAISLRIPFSVKDDGVRQRVGRENVIVNYDIFLDLTSDGKIDESDGRNVKLGQLYEALGMNGPGASIEKLRGKGPVMVKVSQRSDPKDPQTKYAQVDRVAKVS